MLSGGPSIPCAPRVSALTALRHSGRAFTAHVAESAGVPKGLCPFTFRRQPAVAHSCAEFPKTFSPKTRKKCLRYFRRGAIMRWLWGRGSVGRAMRSQRIGQGFESPRLHHHKQTASQKRCRLFMVAQASGERTCRQKQNRKVLTEYEPASSAAAQPTLSPSPSPERNDRRANLYPPSDIRPYGEAPLVMPR